VLLEFPHASTRIEDVAERARTLAAAGASVTVVLAGAPRARAEEGAPELPAAWRVVAADHWCAAVRAALAERPGAWLTCAGEPPQAPARLNGLGAAGVRPWPTRLTGEAGHDREALAAAVAARARGISARSSLWDGRYLVVPGADAEAGVPAAIDAFAGLASDHATLDLVVLGPRAERDAALARRLGVHSRVHWAGWAPLRAECAWLAGASAVLLAGPAAADASLVVRALGAGSPIAVTGEGAVERSLVAWLGEHEAIPASASLARLLAGGEPVKRACARGAEIAGGHEWAALAARWREDPGHGNARPRAA